MKDLKDEVDAAALQMYMTVNGKMFKYVVNSR